MLHVNSLYELYCAKFYHSALEWNDCDVTVVVLDRYSYYNGANCSSFIVTNLFLEMKYIYHLENEVCRHSRSRCPPKKTMENQEEMSNN